MRLSARHAMARAPLPLVVLFGLGCSGTEITVENAIPGASVQGVRWVPPSGTSYTVETGAALGPGATSSELSISELDQGNAGVIHFELVMDGRKVALVTVDSFDCHVPDRSEPASRRADSITPH